MLASGGSLGSIVMPEKEFSPNTVLATGRAFGGGGHSPDPKTEHAACMAGRDRLPSFMLADLLEVTSVDDSDFCNFGSNIPGT